MRLFSALLTLALLSPLTFTAAPLKVDFSIPGRADTIHPAFEQWLLTPGAGDSKTFGDVTVTLSKIGPIGSGLTTTWWKAGLVDGARMVVDGVTVQDGDAGAQMELRLNGLAPGRHTLVTYHNLVESARGDDVGKIDILVNGERQIVGLAPTVRAMNDYEARSAFLEFTARAGEDVVVLFRADTSDPAVRRKNVTLMGFELEASDPARRALKPVPEHNDEHVDADSGSLQLRWTPAAGATAQRVYFGRTAEAVERATPTSPEFLGEHVAADHRVTTPDRFDNYFWRVDQVDDQGLVTKGEVWRFRPRQLAFPGAEGYGRFARGGRGGRLIEVTSLNDSGPGSLRAAVEADGPRTVIFNVSGLITLESRLVIKNPYLTIAGQTAPGKGIAIRKYNFGMSGAHDVVIRHLRVRPGDVAGITLDGMGMASSDHCIIDHCSISWTLDEAFSSRGAKNITLQRTLISEALNIAGHKKYAPGTMHGYAASIGGRIGSFHHNLLAHNAGRNWSLAGALDSANRHTGWLDLRNNVVYNWHHRTTDGGAQKVNYVNNYYKPGPASKVFHLLNPERTNIQGFGPQDYYVAGNVLEGKHAADDPYAGVTKPASHAEFLVAKPFFDSFVETHSAAAAYKHVLSDVGANQPALDEHDARVIAETLAGSATFKGSKSGLPGIPDSQEDVGGWETYPELHRPQNWDTDRDGLPDWWESACGFNPHSPTGDLTESNADSDGDGFTNLEDYLAWMATPHEETTRNRELSIDLAPLTRGFTARPVYAIAGAKNGAATLMADGRAVRFAPASGFTGLASFTFTVTDAEGDSLTKTVNVLVR